MVMRTIHKLRERPKDERVAVAGGISVAVGGVLFVGWAGFVLYGVGGGEVVATNPEPTSQSQQAASAAPAALQQVITPATSSYQASPPSTVEHPAAPSIVQ